MSEGLLDQNKGIIMKTTILAILLSIVLTAGTTVQIFEKKANAMIKRLNTSLSLKKKKTTSGTQLTLGKNIAISLTTDQRGNIEKMIFVGSGNGQASSGVLIITCAAAAVGALSGRTINKKRSGEILKKIGVIAHPSVMSGKQFSFSMYGYDILSSFSTLTGLMIIAEPAH